MTFTHVVAPTLTDAELTAAFAGADVSDAGRSVVFCTPDGDDRYDGIWRVASRDAIAELEWLLPQVARHTGLVVERVALDPEAWDSPHATRFRSGGHAVKIGWFAILDARSVSVSVRGARLSLVIVEAGAGRDRRAAP